MPSRRWWAPCTSTRVTTSWTGCLSTASMRATSVSRTSRSRKPTTRAAWSSGARKTATPSRSARDSHGAIRAATPRSMPQCSSTAWRWDTARASRRRRPSSEPQSRCRRVRATSCAPNCSTSWTAWLNKPAHARDCLPIYDMHAPPAGGACCFTPRESPHRHEGKDRRQKNELPQNPCYGQHASKLRPICPGSGTRFRVTRILTNSSNHRTPDRKSYCTLRHRTGSYTRTGNTTSPLE